MTSRKAMTKASVVLEHRDVQDPGRYGSGRPAVTGQTLKTKPKK
jgi:hypothetical protein